MKRILLTSIAAAGLAAPTLLADYTVFRVCEDQHVIKTSDGAEAGRVEYIVVDPAQQRIVSAVLTGGVVSDRFVAVPFSTIQMGSGRDITLTNITRERLVAAPVIERTRLTSTTVIEPSYFERTYTHFGVSGATGTTVERTRTDVNIDAAGRERTGTERDREMRRDAAGKVTTDPGSAATSTQPADSDRTKAERAKTDADDAAKPADVRDAEKKSAREAEKRAGRDAAKSDSDVRDTDKKKSATESEKEAAKTRSGSRDVKSDEEKSSSPGASGATPPKTDTSAPGASGSTPAAESGTRTSPGKDAQSETSPGASGSTPAAKSGVSSKPEATTPPASSSTPSKSTESGSTPPSSRASESSGQSATPPSSSSSSGAASSDASSPTKPQ